MIFSIAIIQLLLAAPTIAKPVPPGTAQHQYQSSEPIQQAIDSDASWDLATQKEIASQQFKFHEDSTGQPHDSKDLTLVADLYNDDVDIEDVCILRCPASNAEEARPLRESPYNLFLDVSPTSSPHVDVRIQRFDLIDFLNAVQNSLSRCKELPDYTDLRESTRYPNSAIYITSQIAPKPSITDSNEFFREYRPLSILTPWMRLLESLFPSLVQIITVGQSWEQRPIQALRVGPYSSETSQASTSRKTIIITGGSHAREWISVSSVAYTAYNFITGYERDSDITTLLSEVTLIFVPTLNPDGYTYTWEHDRLWRKTRQPGPIPYCNGMDLDSSFSFKWEADLLSGNPCSEHYAGQQPFHAVEAASFSEWLGNQTAEGMDIIGMVDLHSYSQQILIPYAYSCETEPSNEEDLEELAAGMARAIRRTNGEFYQVTSACRGNVLAEEGHDVEAEVEGMSTTGGSPLDWFHHVLGVRYSYQIKLRDTGNYGFLLPAEYIVPTGREVFNAILFFGRSLISDD